MEQNEKSIQEFLVKSATKKILEQYYKPEQPQIINVKNKSTKIKTKTRKKKNH